MSKENLQMKTGLPQYSGDNEKSRDHDIMPVTKGDSKGDVIDKV